MADPAGIRQRQGSMHRFGIAGAEEIQMCEEAVERNRPVGRHRFGQFGRDAKRLHCVGCSGGGCGMDSFEGGILPVMAQADNPAALLPANAWAGRRERVARIG